MRAVHVNPTIEITMIGHSKGGAEAANSVAINTNAIIFNRIRQKSPILYRWVMNAVRYEGYR
ncbi:hypothetical protein SKA13_14270, partial [Enterococcus faecium]